MFIVNLLTHKYGVADVHLQHDYWSIRRFFK